MNKKAIIEAIEVVALVILAAGLITFTNVITGFVTADSTVTYNDELDLTFDEDSEFIWNVGEKELKSLRLGGSVSGAGSVKIYIENDGVDYLIFDSSSLDTNPLAITSSSALAHHGEEAEENTTNPELSGDTNKTIDIKLDYGAAENFDENNDGIEFINGVVDLTVADTGFNWEVDESKLCTKWTVYPLDKTEITVIAHGSERCCNLMGLQPYNEKWDEPLYLSYGRFGVGLENIIEAQIVYADYNLSIPFSDVHLSNSSKLDVRFISDIMFENACVETCTLAGFNKSSYNLRFDIDGDAVLKLGSVEYSAAFEDPGLKLVNRNEREIGSYRINKRLDQKYDIEIIPKETLLEKDWKVEIKGLDDYQISSKIGSVDESFVTTSVFAVESIDIEEAVITLPKDKEVTSIIRCPDFDIGSFTCPLWEKTDISFIDGLSSITFTVNEFSAYAGAGEEDESLVDGWLGELTVTTDPEMVATGYGYGYVSGLWDLGDAPDNTTHFDHYMTAYPIYGPPGVIAHYPTVFDPATGYPQGPCHNITCVWLGYNISAELDADLTPDEDNNTPNLNVTGDVPDLDWYDDSINKTKLYNSLEHCENNTFWFNVTINCTPHENIYYFNVWFDWTLDGDWADNETCFVKNDTPEWAVRNQIINLTGYPPGIYSFETEKFLAYYPSKDDIWTRLTLDPNGTMRYNGSGPGYCFSDGETEDYYLANYAPVFSVGLTNQVGYSGVEFYYDIDCTDPEGDPITYYINNTDLLSIDPSTGLISDVPLESEDGTYKIEVTCGDPNKNTTQTFDYTIQDITDPRLYGISTYSPDYRRNSTFTANITLEDANLDNYTFCYYNETETPICKEVSVTPWQYNASETFNITNAKGSDMCWYYEAVDEYGNTGTSNEDCFTVENTPPTAPGIIVYPDPADASENIYCNVTVNSTDPDGDSFQYRFEWYKDGSLTRLLLAAPGVLSDTLSPSYTSNGEEWNCTVKGYDGQAYGAGSSALTFIGAHAPEAQSVVLYSTDSLNRTNGTLIGSWTFYDADSGSEISNETKWFNNSEEVVEFRNLTSVNAENVSRFENWTFSVRVYDGRYWSNWTNSSVLMIENDDGLQRVTVNSTDNYNGTNGTLIGSWVFYDLDGDTQQDNETRWYNDSEEVVELRNLTSVSPENTTRLEVWTFSVRVNDGIGWSVWKNATITIANTPPTAPVVNITPITAVTTDDLLCNITINSTDFDNDSIQYYFVWYKDGSVIRSILGSNSYDTLVAGNTAKNNLINCSVVPYDGAENGSIGYANVTIGNIAPEAQDVGLTSTDSLNRTNGTLIGSWTFYDIDTIDSQQSIQTRWYNNSELITGLNDLTSIGPGYTTRLENWTFSVRVYDGMAWSNWTNSSVLKIENDPGLAGLNVSSTDSLNRTNGTLVGSWNFADLDGDLQEDNETRWYNDSEEVVELRNATYIGYKNTTRLEVWTFSVRVNDGIEWSSWENATITIENDVRATNLVINSTDLLNRTNGTLMGFWTFEDLDGETQQDNETKWYRNSAEIVSLINSIDVGYRNTTKGQTWIFSARVYDGVGWSLWVNSTGLLIENSAPIHSTPLITSSDDLNRTNGTLYCYNQSTFDWDNDAVTNYYSWYKNRVLIGGETSSSLGAGNFSKYDNLTCQIIPSDSYLNGTHLNSTNLTIENSAPVVNLVSPIHRSYALSSFNFTYNVYDNDGISDVINCTLWKQNETDLVLYNYTENPGSTNYAFFNLTANHTETINWSVNCTDVDRADGLSQVWTIYVDNYNPVPIFIYPLPDDSTIHDKSNQSFNLDVRVWDGNLRNVTLVLADLSGNEKYRNYSGTLSGVEWYNITPRLNINTWASGNYTVYVNASDSEGHFTSVSRNFALNYMGSVNASLINTDSLNRTNGTLVGSWTYYDPDNNSQIGNQTRWYRNGVLQPALNGLTSISPAATTKHDEWTFSVSAFDGYWWTKWSNASVTIVNARPTISSFVLNSTFGTNRTTENLTAYPLGITDLDGDEVVMIYGWHKSPIMALNMPFEGGSNSTYTKDYTEYENHGDVSGASWSSTAGYDGHGAYVFDGINDYIDLGDDESLNLVAGFTISLWFKPDIIDDMYLISKRNNTHDHYSLYLHPWQGKGRIYVVDNEGNLKYTGFNYTPNVWQHVAIVVNNSGAEFTPYKNGVQGLEIGITPYSGSSINLRIGTKSETKIDFFDGTIDQVQIYNRALSAEQVKALYNNRTDLIVSQETKKGETWYLDGTANDMEEDGPKISSNTLTIANSAPTAATVEISTRSPTTIDNLVCNVTVPASDVDGDTIRYYYEWYNSNILVRSVSTTNRYLVLDSSNTAKGQTWNCSVRPYDGQSFGPYDSDTVVIGNIAPQIQNIEIFSSDNLNRTNGSLTGIWTFSDPDYDTQKAVETKWYNNSVEVVGLRNKSMVSSGNVSKGQVWKLSARAYDGINWSDWAETTITIANTAPLLSGPTVNSTIGAYGTNVTTENLTCWASASDVNADLVSYEGYWYRNTELNASFSTGYYVSDIIVNVSTLDSSNTNVNDYWHCYVRAYDGSDYTNYVASDIITILEVPAAPVIGLVIQNNTLVTSSATVDFVYNVSDDTGLDNCSLIINDDVAAVDTVIENYAENTFSVSLSNAVYNWSVSCVDSTPQHNIGNSVTYVVNVSYTAPSAPPPSGGGGGGRTTTVGPVVLPTPSLPEIPEIPEEPEEEPEEVPETPRPIVPIPTRGFCGNDICSATEDVETCPQDCKPAPVERKLPRFAIPAIAAVVFILSAFAVYHFIPKPGMVPIKPITPKAPMPKVPPAKDLELMLEKAKPKVPEKPAPKAPKVPEEPMAGKSFEELLNTAYHYLKQGDTVRASEIYEILKKRYRKMVENLKR